MYIKDILFKLFKLFKDLFSRKSKIYIGIDMSKGKEREILTEKEFNKLFKTQEVKMRKPKFELVKAVNITKGEYYYYFNLISTNGKIVATSQMYKSKQGAIKGINSIKKNAKTAIIEYLD